MTKKKYDWAGVKRLPLGTSFRLPWWSEEDSIHLRRKDSGEIAIFTEKGYELNSPHIGTTNFYLLQDTFTVVDCKHTETIQGIYDDGHCYGMPVECFTCGEEICINNPIHEEEEPTFNQSLCETQEDTEHCSKCGKPYENEIVVKECCGKMCVERWHSESEGSSRQESEAECNHNANTPYEYDEGKKICHYCKSPLRHYVTLGEALANVATGKWKRAAYDGEEWREKYGSVRLHQYSNGDSFIRCGKNLLDYQDAKWYEVKE